MIDKPTVYLVWSNTHHAWLAPDHYGYVQSFKQAGQFSHEEALANTSNMLIGMSMSGGILPEIPVALADVEEMQRQYDLASPTRRKEPWE